MSCAAATAQNRVMVGFYNVENLFDTIRNPMKHDADFTPEGREGWNTERYRLKIKNMARVLDEMNLDVAGLAEVESLVALRDLVREMKTDYCYVHFDTSDPRGLDQVLLYKGDKFIPDTDRRNVRLVPSAAGREFLYVRGKLAGHRVDLVVCHLPSIMNAMDQKRAAARSLYHFVDSLQQSDPAARPIVMGDMNADPTERFMREEMHTGRHAMDGLPFLYNPFFRMWERGIGTYVWDDAWHFYDNIFISSALLGGNALRFDDCGVFIREYLLSDGETLRRGYPLRTSSRGVWLGGYSDHLPVYVTLRF